MMEIITSPDALVVGDVLFVCKMIEPRDREAYWWRAYWIVERKPWGRSYADLMLLKMNPDPDKDHRTFDFGECGPKQVIQYLHPDDYPQGVQAMRLKALTTGKIKLDD